MRDFGATVIYFLSLTRKGSGTQSILNKGAGEENPEQEFNAFHSPRTFRADESP
jgi:hypothetical protein